MPRAKKTNGISGSNPAPRKAPAKGHALPKPLPVGTMLNDNFKGQWILGRHIGQGGFGLIYAARRAEDSETEERHVVKIEPKSNGPLFCEIHFYLSIKLDQVPVWMKKKNLKCLGIPTNVVSGHYFDEKNEYRFLVMERYGEDLQSIFERSGKRFSAPTSLAIALKVIDVLEFIHSMGYVHADIKAANLLLGLPPKDNEVFLVDFGLAYRFCRDGHTTAYKEDPKRRHDGTLEFCCRDAHRGANPAPRGDFETLAFCMLQWLGGQLPWDPLLGPSDQAKDRVFQKKEECMKDVGTLAKNCKAGMPDFIKFLDAIAALSYEESINYDKMRGFLKSALLGLKVDPKSLKLNFDTAGQNKSATSKTAARKRPQASGDARAKSPASKAKSPRMESPASRTKSPASKSKSLASRTKSPLASKTKSPASKTKSPVASKTKSPASKTKSPASRTKSPLASKTKSPAISVKSPLSASSPVSNANSPAARARAVGARARSPSSRASPGPSSAQKRSRLSPPLPHDASSQTSPSMFEAFREQHKQQRRRRQRRS